MDLPMVRQHLAEAEEHVALGERHIARQAQIIEQLACAGHNTELAVDLLDNYRQLQVCHVAHRDRLLKSKRQLGLLHGLGLGTSKFEIPGGMGL
jgi:hypothetical protein